MDYKHLLKHIWLFICIASFWLYLSIVISSCTPQRRLNNLLDKHPALRQNEVINIDTLLPVVTPKDSLLIKMPLIEIKDTVLFQSKQLKVAIWRDKYDTLYVDAKCDTVTVFVPFETTVEVEKIIYKKARDSLIWWVVIAIVVLIIIGFLKKL